MISIIIPVYNEEDYVLKCLESVEKEVSEKDEVVIINDGSTDSSETIIKQFIKQSSISNIRYFKKGNGGLGSACNFGIEKATKEYVLLLDSDDLMAEEQLGILKNKLNKYKTDIIIFDVENNYKNGEKSFIRIDLPNEEIFSLDSNPEILLSPPSAKNKLFKKSLFTNNNIKFPKDLWFEDLLTTTKLYTDAKSILYTKDTRYIYMHRSNSIINSHNLEKNKDILVVYDKLVDYYKKKGMFKKNIYEFYNILEVHVLIFTAIRIIKNSKKVEYSLLNELISEFNHRKDIYFTDLVRQSKIKLTKKDLIIKKLLLKKQFKLVKLFYSF